MDGDRLQCTPKLRQTGLRLIGDTSARFRLDLLMSSRSSRGSVEILEGFPRPVGAVVNLLLVFHRFHQCRHSPWAIAGLLELFRC